VRIRLNHTYDGDIDISLTGPDGTTIDLSSDNGLNGDNYGSGAADCSGTMTVFDDQASTSIIGQPAPFAGVFRPEQALSAFEGKPSQGNWTLRVTDDGMSGYVGTLYCWELVITRAVAGCCGDGGNPLDQDNDGDPDSTDCAPTKPNIHHGAAEVCNGVDDNCDGQIDEGVTQTFYRDADGDGYGNPTVVTNTCTAPNGYVTSNTDCNDSNAAIHPGAIENGIDDNCDGRVDEDCPSLPVVTLTAPDQTATEFPFTTGRFKVTRTGLTTAKLKVFYAISGTATPGIDYEPLKGFVTIQAGKSAANWQVKPLYDGVTEPGETVIVTLTNGPGYVVGISVVPTKVTITDR
jgi:hypothetical protein